MVAITIFWASALAMIFFLLGVVFKGLAAAFNALFSSPIVKFCKYVGLTALIVVVLFVIGLIEVSMSNGTLGSIITIFVILIVILAIGYGLVGWLGDILWGASAEASNKLLEMTSYVLEHGAAFCDEVYGRFLRIIIDRIKKC